MPDPQDIHFMRLAVEQAVKGRETPGGAEVGAVLVRQGEVICTGFNEGEMRHDPTAHGEMVVIRARVRAVEDDQPGRNHAVLHAAAVRYVHAGVPVGGHQPSRLWCAPQGRTCGVFRIAA